MHSDGYFRQQPGGLFTAVFPCDQTDSIHRGTLERVLSDTIKHEAKVHGADFDPVAFRNVMRAMQTGDVEILFLAATWDVCKPKIVGASINFRSLFLKRKGRDIATDDGIYSEDVCLLTPKIRELVAERPNGKQFPEEGLGIHLIRECMNHFANKGMRGNIIPAGQRFEFSPENAKIISLQKQLGATLGENDQSGLLRVDEIADIVRGKWELPVKLHYVPSADGNVDPNNFLVCWSGKNERQKIHAGFTKGHSTFVAKPVAQSQIVSNGDLPEPPVVECVLASMLKAANMEIQERRWGQPYVALEEFKHGELFVSPVFSMERFFGVKPPAMHIHALNEPEIVAGLHSLGAKKRILGQTASQTASLNLEGAVRPLNLIGSEALDGPLFSFA